MKHFYLFLLGLMAFTATAQIQINTPLPFYYCDQDGNGTETINLGDFDAGILGSNNPEEYSVEYFLTEEHAQQNSHQLPYLYTFDVSTTPIQLYVRVAEIANADNFAIAILDIRRGVMPVIPALPAIPRQGCVGMHNLTYNNFLYDPMTVSLIQFYESENDAINDQNPISGEYYYTENQSSVWVRVSNSNAGCFAIAEQQLLMDVVPRVDVIISGQTITINSLGIGPFMYALISGPVQGQYPTPYQMSPVFTNLELGMYVVVIRDSCANTSTIAFEITDIDAPTGETSQTFTEGQTLADLEVTGENILWYDAPTEGNLLPITLPLVDGTTYYAERSLNRARIANRLAVTVHLVLGTNSNSLQTISYYPNPVKNVLTISNASPINNIAIYNTLGQQVLNRGINSTQTNLDLSALSNGIYFVKINAAENKKTIRIIKE